MRGMGYLIGQLRRLNSGAQLTGVLMTMWHNSDVVRLSQAQLTANGWPVMATSIRRSDKAIEASYADQHAVTDYSSRSSAAQDYKKLAAELAERWEWSGAEV